MTKEEILAGESELLAVKRDVTEQSVKYIKTVVAFANGKGGMIVFGVDDTTREAERYMLKELLLEGENESFDQQPAGKTVSKEEVENLCDKIYDFTAGTLSKKERAALRRPTVNQLISWKLLKKEGRSLVASNGFKLLQGTTR